MLGAPGHGHGPPPHSRRARDFGDRARRAVRTTPAFAESTPPSVTRTHPRPDHPRIRGEHAGVVAVVARKYGPPPHSRRAPRGVALDGGPDRTTPAFVESTSRRPRSAPPTRDHPRIRGEHAPKRIMPAASLGPPPHSRRALDPRQAAPRPQGTTPAFAESTHRDRRPRCSSRDHPRIRGEHVILGGDADVDQGPPPHSRRAPVGCVRGRGEEGTTPAFAESTASSATDRRMTRDHPRIRGEHNRALTNWLMRGGPPPHSRRAPSSSRGRRRGRRTTPAFAESTWRAVTRGRRSSDHPRIRGEHLACGHTWAPEFGPPPHSRRAPSSSRGRRRGRRTTPAFAESTWRAVTRGRRSSDHPRIRGEHTS